MVLLRLAVFLPSGISNYYGEFLWQQWMVAMVLYLANSH